MDGKNLYYFGISNIVSWRQPLRRNPCLPDRTGFHSPVFMAANFQSLKEPSSAAFQLHGTKEDI
jgi:hypothetical protein